MAYEYWVKGLIACDAVHAFLDECLHVLIVNHSSGCEWQIIAMG
jgi:hypothetical protein